MEKKSVGHFKKKEERSKLNAQNQQYKKINFASNTEIENLCNIIQI